jgi:hypothetical protein
MVAATLLALTATTPAQGRIIPPPTLILRVTLDAPCLHGRFEWASWAYFDLRTPDGDVVETVTGNADGAGRVEVCFAVPGGLRGGETIVAYNLSQTIRTHRVPRISMTTDRVADTASGTARPGLRFTIRMRDCHHPVGRCTTALTRKVTVDASGTYAVDATGFFDPVGHDIAVATFRSAQGDIVTRRRLFPHLVVAPLTALSTNRWYAGYANPGTTFDVTIRDYPAGGSTQVQATTASVPDGRFQSPPHIIDLGTIDAGFASDAHIDVPLVSFDYRSADHVAKGRCLPHRPVLIRWSDGSRLRHAVARAGADGAWRLDFDAGGAVPPAPATLDISCFTKAGDEVFYSARIPRSP